MSFALHDRLARGSFDLGVHGICRVLLKDQAHFPWILLVPEVDASVTELHQLSSAQFQFVCESMRLFSAGMAEWPGVEKVNVAAIGNQVSQLHIHIVGRHQADIAWPGVVWSCAEKKTTVPMKSPHTGNASSVGWVLTAEQAAQGSERIQSCRFAA